MNPKTMCGVLYISAGQRFSHCTMRAEQFSQSCGRDSGRLVQQA
ncbi:hypothetical protein [Nocardia spumae]|nr:hypothetical protein [Nocardia spumae]